MKKEKRIIRIETLEDLPISIDTKDIEWEIVPGSKYGERLAESNLHCKVNHPKVMPAPDYHQKPIASMTPGEQNSNLVILKAEKPSEFAHALARIRFLKYPDKINALFDLFQKDGMPMGSDDWTAYVYARYSELLEKEKTLRKMKRSVEDLNMAVKFCGSEVHREQSRRLTRAFQQRERAKEYAEHERQEEGGSE